MRQTYGFQSIGLVPTGPSAINSRDEIDTSVDFLGYDLSLPIIVAPMNTVVSEEFAVELERLGGVACLPRDFDFHPKVYHHVPSYSLKSDSVCWSGINKIICIDVANGFNENVGNEIRRLKSDNSDLRIITGNVSSIEGYTYLAKAGVDAVRVGIGTGEQCITSQVTGVATGQASLIRDIATYKRSYSPTAGFSQWPKIIADGGVHTPGDLSKALALGADIVMMGSYFGGCSEAAGPIIKFNERLYKQMAGQASKAIKHSNRHIEGRDTLVPFSGKLEEVWVKLGHGLRSSMSYMNCETIDEFRFLPEENLCILQK